LVAANRLGCVHHTLATCAAARQHGMPPAGIILSRPDVEDAPSMATNAAAIKAFTEIPIWASLSHGEENLPRELLRRLTEPPRKPENTGNRAT
jgi:dethiobiotin synthetase